MAALRNTVALVSRAGGHEMYLCGRNIFAHVKKKKKSYGTAVINSESSFTALLRDAEASR